MMLESKELILRDGAERGANRRFGPKVAALLAIQRWERMKGFVSSKRKKVSGLGGFSLAETQIALAIFIIAIGGMSVTYLFGVRLFEVVRPKLDATDQARALIGKLNYEVKSA